MTAGHYDVNMFTLFDCALTKIGVFSIGLCLFCKYQDQQTESKSLIGREMTKYLRKNREDLKAKIYSKLSLPQEDAEDVGESTPAQLQLDRALRQTQKKKAGVRKLINSNAPHLDFSDEMAQLKWRIDALKNFSKDVRFLHPQSSSLTGQPSPSILPPATFDELYERQRKKFAMLRERRKSKTTDPKYIEMLGNMQQRKQKRKLTSKSKVDNQMRLLNEQIEGQFSSEVQ